MSARTWLWTGVAGAILVFIASPLLLARLGLLDETAQDAPAEKSDPAADPLASTGDDDQVDADFEPGGLRRLIDKHESEGIDATVQAYYRWMRANYERVRALDDYSMTLVKRERVAGRLWPQERMKVKIRHRPFSAYVRHEEPPALAGQEAIFVEGKNDGRLIGHTTGVLGLVGRLKLDPKGKRAMQGNLHPITETGLLHMVGEVVVGIPRDVREGISKFTFRKGVEVYERTCTSFEVQRTVRGSSEEFFRDEMFIDDELLVPIHYIMYDWPNEPDGEPVFRCEYSHLDLKFNNGFTDSDFDPDNPDYDY